jgi:hypothetical protein
VRRETLNDSSTSLPHSTSGIQDVLSRMRTYLRRNQGSTESLRAAGHTELLVRFTRELAMREALGQRHSTPNASGSGTMEDSGDDGEERYWAVFSERRSPNAM